MTRQCGLLLYDPQIDRLYDPRGHVEVQVELGGEVQVPYLSPSLLAEYFERPERDAPWLIVEREDHVYIQAYLKPGGAVEVEHRRGGPDQHYAVTTDDPELARSIIWMWASGDPAWESALRWQHVTV